MRIGVQTGDIINELGIEKGYALLADIGFDAVDINIDHALNATILKNAPELKDICIFERPLDEVLEYYKEHLDALKKHGIVPSQAHAPFPAYIPERPETLDYCIGIYRRCIEFCHAIGCGRLIIHGISCGITNTYDSVEDIKAYNYKLYRGLIDTLKDTDVTVCLENLFSSYAPPDSVGQHYAGVCSDPHEAVEYIDTLNAEAGKECFGLCLDTGHLHILKIRFSNYIPILGKRIKALHIHDNTMVHDTHKAPYSGTIKWAEFTEELRKIGYDGDLCFETFRQTSKKVIPLALAPAFLTLIHEIGVYFRSEITKGE